MAWYGKNHAGRGGEGGGGVFTWTTDWTGNVTLREVKGQNRLSFLRKLRSFNVCSKMLHISYQSVVASAIFFTAICQGSSIRASDSKKLNKLVKKTGFVLGAALEPLKLLVERRMSHKQHNGLHTTLLVRQQSAFSHTHT